MNDERICMPILDNYFYMEGAKFSAIITFKSALIALRSSNSSFGTLLMVGGTKERVDDQNAIKVLAPELADLILLDPKSKLISRF